MNNIVRSKTIRDSTWLSALNTFQNADAIRDFIQDRYPFLASGLPKRLAILGSGTEGKRLAEICVRVGIEIVGCYDNDATKRGLLLVGVQVKPFDALTGLDRSVPVIVASHRVLGAIATITALGFQAAPFALLQVLYPTMFYPHMFYQGLVDDLLENRSKIFELAGRLADNESIRVLDSIVGYRMTLDPKLLGTLVDWDLYGFSEIMQFGSDEVYVDGGAFDGDSIRMFMENVGGRYERILGFEPDINTFQRLQMNLNGLPNISLYNCGLYKTKSTLEFSNDGSRGSIISVGSGFKIEVISLDEVLQGSKVTLIKLNIEGAEQEALRGAAASIDKWKPKLAISVYHRPADLWKIPELVIELLPKHRLYLRQHDGGIIESVLYAHG